MCSVITQEIRSRMYIQEIGPKVGGRVGHSFEGGHFFTDYDNPKLLPNNTVVIILNNWGMHANI